MTSTLGAVTSVTATRGRFEHAGDRGRGSRAPGRAGRVHDGVGPALGAFGLAALYAFAFCWLFVVLAFVAGSAQLGHGLGAELGASLAPSAGMVAVCVPLAVWRLRRS